MKKIVPALAAASCFALAMQLAQAAESGPCHDQRPGVMHGQPDGGLFGHMDANGNGTVSAAEYRKFHASRFKQLDANKDGKLSLEEMQGGHGKHADNVADCDTRKSGGAKGECDTKGGGTAGSGASGSMGPGTTHLDQRFNAADANQDGGLNQEEARNMPMLSMYFDEVDANKDGKVTRQEYFDAMPLLHRVKQEKAESL